MASLQYFMASYVILDMSKIRCRYIAVFLLLLSATMGQAQVSDTIYSNTHPSDTLINLLEKEVDSLERVNRVLTGQLEEMQRKMDRLEDKQKFYEEKESFYKVEAMRDLRETNEQLLLEKEKYTRLNDSLRLRLN